VVQWQRRFVPVDYEVERLCISEADPVGSMIVSAKFGKTAASTDFSLLNSRNFKGERCWARLRNGVPLRLEHDVFNALSASNSVNLWIWASFEPGFQQHPKTGDTVLYCFVAPNR
jgi:hypothetical protein